MSIGQTQGATTSKWKLATNQYIRLITDGGKMNTNLKMLPENEKEESKG